MAKQEVLLPAMGEGIIEANVTRILAKEGQMIEADEPMFEVATDKVDSEVPAPYAGKVVKIMVDEGESPKVGAVLAIIETEGGDETDSPRPQTEPTEPEAKPAQAEQIAESLSPTEEPGPEAYPSRTPGGKFLSPLVRNIATDKKLSPGTLDQIDGTGVQGRLTKEDLTKYLAAPETGTKTAQAPRSNAAPAKVSPGGTGSYEIVEMDRMRKLIADHMIASVQTSPHVTSFTDVDMTPIVNWRTRNKNAFQQKYGQKLTFMPFFLEAMARAVRDFPMINASVDGDKILVKKDVNIGMAAALPNGNLIVPVVKGADQMNLAGLASQVNDLATRARDNKLLPDEIQGGTITLTNVGSFGNTSGTPIINQPQVAILAIGAIRKKPAVIETPDGDTIGIRHMMVLSLSYDHRVVDGALGGSYLQKVADYLEAFDGSRGI